MADMVASHALSSFQGKPPLVPCLASPQRPQSGQENKTAAS